MRPFLNFTFSDSFHGFRNRANVAQAWLLRMISFPPLPKDLPGFLTCLVIGWSVFPSRDGHFLSFVWAEEDFGFPQYSRFGPNDVLIVLPQCYCWNRRDWCRRDWFCLWKEILVLLCCLIFNRIFRYARWKCTMKFFCVSNHIVTTWCLWWKSACLFSLRCGLQMWC